MRPVRRRKLWYTFRVTDECIERAKADIEATGDLLERALKLSGLVTTLFQEHGFPLVVVGGSAVEFYTEGGYMSGDVDFCRKSLKAIPLRLMSDIMLRQDSWRRRFRTSDSTGQRRVAWRTCPISRYCRSLKP